MHSDKNSDRVGRERKNNARRALDEALRSESNYDYGPATDIDHLRTRIEARAASIQSEKRTIMGRLYTQINNMTRRPRLAVTAAVAVAALALFTLVPFTYQDTIGYEVAFAGVDRDVALDKTRLHEVLEQLGVEGAVVDVFGCEETCNLRITDLKTAHDAQLVRVAFAGSKNVRPLDAGEGHPDGVKVMIELKSGNLLDKAHNVFFASGDDEDASFGELHKIVLEKLGNDFDADVALWINKGDLSGDCETMIKLTEPGDNAFFYQSADDDSHGTAMVFRRDESGSTIDLLDAQRLIDELGAFRITLAGDHDGSTAGHAIMCIGDSGKTFECSIDDLSLLELKDGTLSDEDIERLRQKGYTVEIQEREDGGRTITLTRVSEGESGGNSWIEKDVVIETTDDDPLGKSASTLPEGYTLSQNYPNPFNPTTKIDYSLAASEQVTIEIINVMGQVVRTLVDETVGPGQHTVEWDATSDSGMRVSSGMYFYRFRAGDVVQTRKMTLLK
ncbi:MAG: T9SS type A sorting domain-containing protein [Candidatus Zixiibacteriota bacterium]